MPTKKDRTLVTVTGATGHVGRVVAEQLLAKGLAVRAVGRSASKLRELKAKGAEPFEGSVLDGTAISKAFEGARGVFLMLPPNPAAPDNRAYQDQVAATYESAARKAGVAHVVLLSSIGAHLDKGTGPIQGVRLAEKRLGGLPGSVAVECLRPVFFMENHLFGLGVIQGMGIYGTPLQGDVQIPQIAARDIGRFAAERLAAGPGRKRVVTELYGPRDISSADSAKILGAGIGRPDLRYVQFPYDDARKAMLGMGMSTSVVDDFIEMYQAFNEGRIRGENDRSKSPKASTTLEEWARTDFKPAYEASTAGAPR